MSTTTDTGVRLVAAILDEGFAGGDVSAADRYCAPNLVEHQFGLAGQGTAAIARLRGAIQDVHRAVPDLEYTIESVVEDGDVTWVRSTGRGTASGPFFGPPSHRPVEITVVDIVRVEDGRIVEHWGVPDRFALLAQTGVLDRLAGREG